MDWMDLHSLLAVAREKSITRASVRVHLTQSTLTTRIRKLEDELGAKLLVRSPSGVRLTDLGSRVLYHAIRAKREMGAMLAGTGESGESAESRQASTDGMPTAFKIGAASLISPAFLDPLLRELRLAFPGFRYDLMAEQPELIAESIVLDDVQLGVVPRSSAAVQGVLSVPLYEEEMVLVIPSGGPPLAPDDPKTPRELLGRTFVTFYECVSVRTSIDAFVAAWLGGMPEDIRRTNDVGYLLRMVASGTGFAIVPRSLVYGLETPPGCRLYRLSRPGSPEQDVCLVYAEASPYAARLRAVAERLTVRYRSDRTPAAAVN
ncbi:LysR family transcriptional regulator [Cohnella sp. AR92]|uniref:LysR family transcriptional regulator n=1 Tax=Cohnella sp. AR92 TaxID=648716 RepID=UPI00131552AB|nr:LysR family transcriptional regulator [Cohnella sp. AR92]